MLSSCSKLQEACGVFGVFGSEEASKLTYLGLYALQHRGQESTGIASSDGKQIYEYKRMGLVSEVFDEPVLRRLLGDRAIGHNRYSTTGSTILENAQPLVIDFKRGPLAIAHNGNLVNAAPLRREMERQGSIFQSTLDSEVIVHLIARSRKGSIVDMVVDALKKVRGAYSLLFLTLNGIIAVRDPRGFRPLCMGRLPRGGYVFASESCALDIVDASYLREINPGELVMVNSSGLHSLYPFSKTSHYFCIFELIYFARPDSLIFGVSADKARRSFGRCLAREHPAHADMVISVPDSSNSTALGFSEESRISLELGLIRNHYIGRTFIQPTQSVRDFEVKVKFNQVKDILRRKRVVVVDDSIVRGSTSQKLIKMIKQVGATEVHLRIGSPPIRYPCFYGIDTPTRRELIAANYSVKEIGRHLGVDSLGYLSVEGLLNSAPLPSDQFCVACFTGDYPLKPSFEV